MATDIIT